jgi:hypothetical protein
MKGTLFILSIIFFVSCESKHNLEKSEEFNLVNHLDSVFSLAQKWSGDEPPIPNELLDSINAHMDSVEIHYYDNNIEPQGILFTAPSKNSLLIVEQTTTLKNLNKVSYQSYDVWRSAIEEKEILEFSLQPHPIKKWVFSIRKRSQE